MFDISTNGIVRTVLISSFASALLIGAGGAYFLLHERAIARTAAEAGRLLSAATAVRSYTDQHITPLLRNDGKFHAQIVPAFAAQTVYRIVQEKYPGYIYREPALKPTNPNDLPTPFEVRASQQVPRKSRLGGTDGRSRRRKRQRLLSRAPDQGAGVVPPLP